MGDKSCAGLYSAVGEFLARQGFVAVLPNYRLSPWVKHPEHVRDVARAVAWTRRDIVSYGGDPRRLVLAGHSAGGHLIALLATDDSYLRAEGVPPEDVRGVIGVSGVYRIPHGRLDVALGGTGDRAFFLDEVFPLRGATPPTPRRPFMTSGVPLSLNIFGPAFGDDPDVRAAASPIHHVRAGLPPFLLITAERDLPTLPEMAADFARALREHGNDARSVRVGGRNHNSIMFRATSGDDPVASALVEFVREVTGK